MIEMLGVLAIIGVLSVGGIAGYSKAMMKFKINKTIDQIAMTVTNIRTLYAQQNTYKELDTTNAAKMGVVDDAMINGTNLINPFDGNVYISYAKSGAVGENSDYGAFLLTLTNLPREACVAIATNDWGSNYSSGLIGIGARASTTTKALDISCGIAGGTSVTAAAIEGKTDVLGTTKAVTACASTNQPLSVSQAATGCDCSDTTNSNSCTVTFKYF